MVRTYWFVPIFYEAIDILDLQPSARSDSVEACRPLGWCPTIVRSCECRVKAWLIRVPGYQSTSGGKMTIHEFDVVILGAGPAGEAFAGHAAAAGLRTAVVEQELVGGECAFYACMPSKALLRPGEVLDESNRMEGVKQLISGGLDADAVLKRRDEVIHELDDSSQMPWLEERGIELFRGTGVIAGEREVRIDGEVLVANRAVVVATGSSAAMPPVPGIAETPVWSNRQGTTIDRVPDSLIIFGGGPVGCELAQAWASLGSAVTLFEPEDRVLTKEEPFASEQVATALRERHGVNLITGTEVDSVEPTADGVLARTGSREHPAAALMLATGRRPRSDDIGLESVGIESGGPLETGDDYRVPGHDWLFAVGDVNGRAALTQAGKYQAWVAVQSLLGRDPGNTAERMGVPRVTFTNPQVAATGMTLAQAKEAGIDAVAIDVDSDSTPGASFVGKGVEGTSRLVIDRADGLIIGATFTGFEVAEWLHAATIAMIGKTGIEQLRHAVAAFPTRSEVWLRLVEQWESEHQSG